MTSTRIHKPCTTTRPWNIYPGANARIVCERAIKNIINPAAKNFRPLISLFLFVNDIIIRVSLHDCASLSPLPLPALRAVARPLRARALNGRPRCLIPLLRRKTKKRERRGKVGDWPPIHALIYTRRVRYGDRSTHRSTSLTRYSRMPLRKKAEDSLTRSRKMQT